MNNQNHKVTLEDISRRKMEVLESIRIQHNVMSETIQEIFSPIFPPRNQGKSSLMAKFNAGMSIFEGVIIGMKIFYRIRKMFLKR